MKSGTTIIWCGAQVRERRTRMCWEELTVGPAVLGAGKDRSWMLGAED